jgi:2-polyprenyl-3-methyl-5-hydroxy-6-metoxy-1,4-benzoquinol methylase
VARNTNTSRELYEHTYNDKRHFSFGKNWQEFLKKLTAEKLDIAKGSLVEFLGRDIKGKTFIDVGCGSGIFSLAAVKLGAKVTSIDVDDNSLACATFLKQKYAKNADWKIMKASALDKDLARLGKFDIIYSWGVLHHTGDMKAALRNVSRIVKKSGKVYIAIYNNNEKHVFEGTSKSWTKIKRIYNKSPASIKRVIYLGYTAYLLTGITATLHNPVKYVKNYQTVRGMDFFTDVKDWIGGYPYEYASADEIVKFFSKLGFKAIKVKLARSLGCNEFLFRKK